MDLQHILTKLVGIPSVTGDRASSEQVIDYVYDLLKPTGIRQTKGDINGYPYLIASTQKPNSNTVWYVSHLDVVPAEDKLFALTSDDQNYYGRGVCDMKGMAAAVLAALLKIPNLTDINVGLLFTTDEETGGKNGVGALVDKDFKGAAAFVLDQSTDWVLTEKMKGVMWLEITAEGQAAHGARPWLGHSANQTMIDYLHALSNWYSANMPQSAPGNYYTTYNLGTVHGGAATNQISDTAVATVDIRFVSEEDANKVLQAAKSLAATFSGIHIKKLMHEPCVITDKSEKWYNKTLQLMQELDIRAGDNGEPLGHGSTDGRFFAPYNISVISTRPPSGGQHGPKEWASKQGLQQLERLTLELMLSTADS